MLRPTNGNTCESISLHVRVSVFNRTGNSTYIIRVHMIFSESPTMMLECINLFNLCTIYPNSLASLYE